MHFSRCLTFTQHVWKKPNTLVYLHLGAFFHTCLDFNTYVREKAHMCEKAIQLYICKCWAFSTHVWEKPLRCLFPPELSVNILRWAGIQNFENMQFIDDSITHLQVGVILLDYIVFTLPGLIVLEVDLNAERNENVGILFKIMTNDHCHETPRNTLSKICLYWSLLSILCHYCKIT